MKIFEYLAQRAAQAASIGQWKQSARRLSAALAFCVAAVLPAASAVAAIFVPVKDGDGGIAQVSIKDPTRVTVEGARILQVIGDVYDAEKNPGGRISVQPITATGDIYVQPVKGEVIAYRPVRVDLLTDRGTYGVLFQPLDAPADTVIVQPRGKAAPKVAGAGSAVASNDASYRAPQRGLLPEYNSPNHFRNIKGWMLAMASDTVPERVDVRPFNMEIGLWAQTRFVLVDGWYGAGFVGERYELTNKSKDLLVIDEREFYRKGVIGITVQKHEVDPGNSTKVWILRVRNENE